LLFKKENPKSYANIESGIYIKNSRYYSFGDDENNIGHFYCTENESVGIFKNSQVMILLSKNTFTDRYYDLRNLNNNAPVGNIAISNFTFGKSLRTTIDIIHQDLYNWEVLDNSFGFSMLTSKTWSSFSGRLFNSNEEAKYDWDYAGDVVYANKLDIPVKGQIKLSNPQNHFLLFAGMFLMEMELQLRDVDLQ
jgi:hypothetical protein